jgi:DNA-binding transcriptional ArsR family regulator
VDNDAFNSEFCAERLKALGEPIRLRIIDVLRHGELTVSDIAEFLETEVVTISHHLQILKRAKLLEAHREGRFIYYKLHEDLLKAARDKKTQFLDLGCCRLEMPPEEPQ